MAILQVDMASFDPDYLANHLVGTEVARQNQRTAAVLRVEDGSPIAANKIAKATLGNISIARIPPKHYATGIRPDTQLVDYRKICVASSEIAKRDIRIRPIIEGKGAMFSKISAGCQYRRRGTIETRNQGEGRILAPRQI
jgi:hypothetical protein